MKRDTTTSAEDLDRPEGNSLEENYLKHDVGHAVAVGRLRGMGFEVEEWGIDMRHDDGDGVIYDDKMDFKIRDEDGSLVALLDVKTKSNPRWMGRFNKRHYEHYHRHAREFGVPTFVVMFQVDHREQAVYDEFVFEIGLDDAGERVHASDESAAVRSFPDGNEAVLVPHGYRKRWRYLEQTLQE